MFPGMKIDSENTAPTDKSVTHTQKQMAAYYCENNFSLEKDSKSVLNPYNTFWELLLYKTK